MSERLTQQWTENSGRAFGQSGWKGDIGEKFLLELFKSWKWDCISHNSDRDKQLKGIDISFKNPKWRKYYTCDCKNNMDEYGNFYVYKDWLFKVECDRIFHVNPDTGWIAWYDVDYMREHYNKAQSETEYIKITPSDTISFISRRKVEL